MSKPVSLDWRSLYPFASHEVRIRGYRYHYLDEGSGPPLVMVHGNPTWSFFFRNLVLALRDRYRVIVPDHIGCGLSDKPPFKEYSYHLADRVSDLNQFLNELELPEVTLVAHDWGGAVGMGAAVARPERFTRFVLMNTAAFRAKCPWQIHIGHMPLVGRMLIQGLNVFVREATRSTVVHHERMTPAVRAGLMAPYDSWANRVGVYGFVNDIPLTPAHPTHATLVAIENGLAQFRNRPICLVWGMQDWCFTPDFLDRFIGIFPEAEVHRLPDVGHYLLEDAPEEVAGIVREFLGRTEGANEQ